MAEEEPDSDVNSNPPHLSKPSLPFLEVICKSSGKTQRFAAGTEAGFAVSLINRKLDGGPPALYIESVKEGEESVSFGPSSVLVDYGDGWKLQTVNEVEGLMKGGFIRSKTGLDGGSHPVEQRASQPVINFLYMGKILLAFILIFVMGALFTLALENLPRLILFINSSM